MPRPGGPATGAPSTTRHRSSILSAFSYPEVLPCSLLQHRAGHEPRGLESAPGANGHADGGHRHCAGIGDQGRRPFRPPHRARSGQRGCAQPDIFVRPDIQDIRVLDFYRFEEIFKQGIPARNALETELRERLDASSRGNSPQRAMTSTPS